MANLDILFNSIVAGKLEPAVEITQEAINEHLDPQMIINNYMIKGMEEIGKRFREKSV